MIRGFEKKEPKIARSAFIANDAIVIGDVEIGEDSSIWFGSVVRGDVNYIRIGARTNIQDLTVIHEKHMHERIGAAIGVAES